MTISPGVGAARRKMPSAIIVCQIRHVWNVSLCEFDKIPERCWQKRWPCSWSSRLWCALPGGGATRPVFHRIPFCDGSTGFRFTCLFLQDSPLYFPRSREPL